MALIAESKNFSAPDDNATNELVSLTSSVWGSEAAKTHLVFGQSDSIAVNTDIQNSFGWSDGTDNVAIGFGSQNGVGTSVCNRAHQTSYNVYPLSNNGGIYERAVQSSYNASTPSIGHTWSNSATEGYNYFLWALGGDDVENISLDVVTSPGSTGDQSYTGPGFQPDFLIVMHSVATALPLASVHIAGGIGISDGTTDAYVNAGSRDAVTTSYTNSRLSTKFIHYYNITNLAEYETATVKSLDSSGYTLTWDLVSGTSRKYTIIAVKGPSAKVVASKQPASNTTNDVSTATYSTGTATVKPNADGTVSGTWTAVGGAGSRHASVSHGTGSPDDTEYVQNLMSEGDSAEHMYLGFENMPADFATLTSVTGKIRQKGYNNDDDHVKFQIFKADGSTPLTGEIELDIDGSAVSTSFRTDTVNFVIGGDTDKTSWDGAQIKITHVGPGDGDDPEYYVSEIQLELTYITSTVTDSGFVPKAGLCIGAMKTESHVPSSHNRFTLGTWDAQDNMDSGGWMDENGQTTTDVDRFMSTSYSVKNYNHAQSVVGRATVAAEGNGIRETWTSTDGTQYAHAWLLLGDAPVTDFAEIQVTGLSDNVITDGDSTPTTTDGTDFGSVTQNDSTVTRTFKVANSGAVALTTETPSVPTGFTLTEGLATSIATSGNDTFSVRLDNSVVGVKHGDISFVNSDADHTPFNFAVSGVVTAAAETPAASTGITSIISSGVSQLNSGNSLVSVAGARGLGASGTLITEITNTNRLDRTINEPGAPIGVLDSRFEDRMDETSYYAGSGAYWGSAR